jgi:hypothetical protein
MNVPFRYDLPNSASVNSSIIILNRKLKKLVKAFPNTSFTETPNNRNLFTNHGLHLNKIGKRFVIHQLASSLQSIFKHKISVPISLSWPNVIQDINILTCEENQMKLPNRNSSHNRKLPITISNDFLW